MFKKEDMKPKLREILSHVLIIVFFAIISIAYFYPTLSGKVLRQMDLEHSIAISHEAHKYEMAEHRDIAWTNSLFGGMPTYQIGGIHKPNIFSVLLRLVNHTILPYATVSSMFLYLLGFYLLLLTFRVDKWLSFVGAIAFALSSYNIIIIAAGHVTKTYAIGLMPLVLAGFVMLYDRRWILGTLTALLGLGLQLATSHIQIIYYTFILVGIYIVFRFIWDLKSKELNKFFIATAMALGVVILAVLPNLPTMWQAYEMSKYSIRGKSELAGKNSHSSGLDKDYALAWSYGRAETFTLFIPNFNGGISEPIGNNPTAINAVDSRYKQTLQQLPLYCYWGEQPFTSGPVYFGAIIIFLAVLAMFIVRDRIKWFLFAATIISIVLAWGKHAGFITDFMFNYFPFYNKFRTASMILVIASLTTPLLAFLGLKEIIERKDEFKKNLKPLWWSFAITGGLALLIWLFAGAFSYKSSNDTQIFDYLTAQYPQAKAQIGAIFEQLKPAREALLKADAMRSLLFVILSTAAILLYLVIKDFKKTTFISVLGILILIDMWTVDRRYLKASDFVNKSKAKLVFEPSAADEVILKDKDPYFRVLNLTTSTFNDAFTSYFHKSIGGYSGAKLRRYQDVIDEYLAPYVNILKNDITDSTSNMESDIAKMQFLNMLNTKYIIYNPKLFPIVNTHAFGNAWFVDNLEFVNSPQEEINSIKTTDMSRTAVINQKKFDVSKLPTPTYASDSSRKVELSVYKPDILIYNVSSKRGGFVVFSDIYYPKGWKATIDGKKTKIYETDYILRGIYVPAGNHQVKFEFHPAAVYVANKIALVGSIIVGIILLLLLYKIFSEKNNKKIEKNKKQE